jgi:hypothetical protein
MAEMLALDAPATAPGIRRVFRDTGKHLAQIAEVAEVGP